MHWPRCIPCRAHCGKTLVAVESMVALRRHRLPICLLLSLPWRMENVSGSRVYIRRP